MTELADDDKLTTIGNGCRCNRITPHTLLPASRLSAAARVGFEAMNLLLLNLITPTETASGATAREP